MQGKGSSSAGKRGKKKTKTKTKQNPKPHRSPRIPPAPRQADSPGTAASFPAQTRCARHPAWPRAAALLLPHVLDAHPATSGLPPTPHCCPGAPPAQGAVGGGRQPRSQPPQDLGEPRCRQHPACPAKASRHRGAGLAPARTPPRPPWPWAAACGPGCGVGRSAEALRGASRSPAASLGHVALGWLEGRILATSFSDGGGSAAVMINPRRVNRSVLQPFFLWVSSAGKCFFSTDLPRTWPPRWERGRAQGKSPRAAQAGAGDPGSGHDSGQDLARPWLLGPGSFLG